MVVVALIVATILFFDFVVIRYEEYSETKVVTSVESICSTEEDIVSLIEAKERGN